ncbi:hypothetical protein [Candidatus Protofrankia californiensis]|uniref:hypothetical protein n=1 Tax=Candidatus Protofrankia californiensis TaxID=1839754 RepID=UPI0013EB88E3|nr:hypothetical protein [Candidatus Protofrankia californiensis]
MPTSFQPPDCAEIIPSSTFGLVIEVSEDVEISVFSGTEEAAEKPILASLVTRAPQPDDGHDNQLLSIHPGPDADTDPIPDPIPDLETAADSAENATKTPPSDG